MACNLTTILTSACASQIVLERDQIQLLQLTAQSLANQMQNLVPGTIITPDAIYSRACTSGIALEQDPIQLMQLIAQSFCSQIA